MSTVVVIGLGVGGLTAALLAKAGSAVTALEGHSYPGGCAATFPRPGYRFDAGATVSGGFCLGGPMAMASAFPGGLGTPVRRTYVRQLSAIAIV